MNGATVAEDEALTGREAGTTATTPGDGRLQTAARWLLGGGLLFTGTAHLTFGREEFQGQIPNWMPIDHDAIILASGVVELALGLALLSGRKRVLVGWATAALFVAVFPGNVAQWAEGSDAFGLETDRGRFIRLFFQPVFIAWALWSTGAWQMWRRGRRRAPTG